MRKRHVVGTGPQPVLKWAGGKQGIVRQLLGRFPTTFTRFYEPFVGGASVVLALQPSQAILGDQNSWLLDTYEAVRTDPDRVARLLDGMVNSRTEFLRIRAIPPERLDLFGRAAQLIYLNKTCFRGLFRVNRGGQFNVPYGAYRRRYYDLANLHAFAEVLRNAELRCGDFADCLKDVTRDDFVYLDPPYHKLGGYSDFNRYTQAQFRETDHERLAILCRDLDRRQVRWAVSNSDTPFIRSLFAGFQIQTVNNRREINLDARNRGIVELLIANFSASSGQPHGLKVT